MKHLSVMMMLIATLMLVSCNTMRGRDYQSVTPKQPDYPESCKYFNEMERSLPAEKFCDWPTNVWQQYSSCMRDVASNKDFSVRTFSLDIFSSVKCDKYNRNAQAAFNALQDPDSIWASFLRHVKEGRNVDDSLGMVRASVTMLYLMSRDVEAKALQAKIRGIEKLSERITATVKGDDMGEKYIGAYPVYKTLPTANDTKVGGSENPF